MSVHASGPPPRLRLGVSACLLGQPVRYDGGHKRDPWLCEQLGPLVEWRPVCPEVELGMGTPRETVQLVEIGGSTHMIAGRSGRDWTEPMNAWARRRLDELASEGLRGYVLKKDSPSCGLAGVKLSPEQGTAPARNGRGLFAAALLERFPLLPVEDEGRLQDAHLRENFIERIFAYDRLLRFFQPRWRISGLLEFHAAHKLQLISHGASETAALGRLVAAAKQLPRDELRQRYQIAFMHLLARQRTDD